MGLFLQTNLTIKKSSIGYKVVVLLPKLLPLSGSKILQLTLTTFIIEVLFTAKVVISPQAKSSLVHISVNGFTVPLEPSD